MRNEKNRLSDRATAAIFVTVILVAVLVAMPFLSRSGRNETVVGANQPATMNPEPIDESHEDVLGVFNASKRHHIKSAFHGLLS